MSVNKPLSRKEKRELINRENEERWLKEGTSDLEVEFIRRKLEMEMENAFGYFEVKSGYFAVALDKEEGYTTYILPLGGPNYEELVLVKPNGTPVEDIRQELLRTLDELELERGKRSPLDFIDGNSIKFTTKEQIEKL